MRSVVEMSAPSFCDPNVANVGCLYDRVILAEFLALGGGMRRHAVGPARMTWRFASFTLTEDVGVFGGLRVSLTFDDPVRADEARGKLLGYGLAVARAGYPTRVFRDADSLLLKAAWNTRTVREEIAGVLSMLCGLVVLPGGGDVRTVGFDGGGSPSLG